MPLVGAASGRCVTCHKPGDIGRLTTTGLAVAKPLVSMPFHQKLLNQDCVACHSDHAGAKRLRPQGHFDHGPLQAGLRNECQTCHKTPGDALHKQATGNCLQCHSQDKWVPATFDHDTHFILDRDHNTRCTTCHVANDYKRYTCYGCHEHTQENIRRKHIKEGIRDYSNCVECHRSANEHEGRGKNGERGRGDRKHNDAVEPGNRNWNRRGAEEKQCVTRKLPFTQRVGPKSSAGLDFLSASAVQELLFPG